MILNAIVSDASLTLIGIDDLQISNANFSPSCNVIYIGLSTITAAKFSTLYTSAFDGLSNLSVSVDLINSRQIKLNIRKNNRLMVKMNILNNLCYELNNVIPLDWFNMSINHFKISRKNLFLTNRAF